MSGSKLLFLFILAFLMRIVFFDTSYVFWDESIYLMHGQLYAGMDAAYTELFQRPPLLSWLIAPLALTPWYLALSKIFVIVFNSFIVVPTFYLGNIISKKTGFFAGLIMAALPASILFSRQVMTDHPASVLGLSTIVLFYYGLQNKRLLYLGGLCLGLSILMKFTNLFLLSVILYPLFILAKKKRWKTLATAAVFGMVPFLPYLVHNIIVFGNAFQPFITALHVVQESDPIGIMMLLFLLWDALGLLLIASLWKIRGPTYLKYGFGVVMLWSIFLLFRGVAKPPGIEWEAERFLLLAMPYFAVFSAKTLSQMKRPFIAIAVILLLMAPQYRRTYTPQIAFEEGLRTSTKEMGLYMKESDIASFTCKGNCPPIAFYSGKDMEMVFDESKLQIPYVVFEEREGALMHKTCKMNSCVYLYK